MVFKEKADYLNPKIQFWAHDYQISRIKKSGFLSIYNFEF